MSAKPSPWRVLGLHRGNDSLKYRNKLLVDASSVRHIKSQQLSKMWSCIRQDLFVWVSALNSSILMFDEAVRLFIGDSRLKTTPRFPSCLVCGSVAVLQVQRATILWWHVKDAPILFADQRHGGIRPAINKLSIGASVNVKRFMDGSKWANRSTTERETCMSPASILSNLK